MRILTLILVLIIVFLVFSFLGWVYETRLLKKSSKDTLLGGRVPLLTIYGLGGVVLLLLFITLPLPLWGKILVATVVITLLECLGGQLSLRINGRHTWNYSNKWCPLCDNYVSIETSFYWLLGISVFYLLLNFLLNYTALGRVLTS